jgi:hypothetical protein
MLTIRNTKCKCILTAQTYEFRTDVHPERRRTRMMRSHHLNCRVDEPVFIFSSCRCFRRSIECYVIYLWGTSMRNS